MKVVQIAANVGITPETVRYYTRKGLLSPTRGANGYKDYSESDQKRLHFIVNARHLGFSVSDVEDILVKADKGETPCPTVREIIEQRLEETEKRFQEVKTLRDRMKKAIKQWEKMPDDTVCGHSICHLIDAVDGEV